MIGAGVLLGTVANSLTSESIAWQRPSRYAITRPAGAAVSTDQAGAGQAWARSAFSGGLRRCPQLNTDFVTACEAEIAALLTRPDLRAGSYGGPLLNTKVEPIATTWPDEAQPDPPPATTEEPPLMVRSSHGSDETLQQVEPPAEDNPLTMDEHQPLPD